MVDLYEILQVSPNAEQEVIEAAYRRLAQKYHPDVNRSPEASERMTAINRAYEVISDPERRARYDVSRAQRAKPPPRAEPAPPPRAEPRYQSPPSRRTYRRPPAW